MDDIGLESNRLAAESLSDDPGIESRTTHAPAAPDLPGAIGYAVIGVFGLAVLCFMTFFGGSAQSRFMTAVTSCFLVVYVTVPVVFFMIQPKPMRKMTWSQFGLKGLHTRSGHVKGREALLQIMSLPISLMMAAIALGLVWVLGH